MHHNPRGLGSSCWIIVYVVGPRTALIAQLGDQRGVRLRITARGRQSAYPGMAGITSDCGSLRYLDIKMARSSSQNQDNSARAVNRRSACPRRVSSVARPHSARPNPSLLAPIPHSPPRAGGGEAASGCSHRGRGRQLVRARDLAAGFELQRIEELEVVRPAGSRGTGALPLDRRFNGRCGARGLSRRNIGRLCARRPARPGITMTRN